MHSTSGPGLGLFVNLTWVVVCLRMFSQVSIASGASAIYSQLGFPGYIMRGNCMP